MPRSFYNDTDVALGIDYPIQMTGQSGGFKQTFLTARDVVSQINVLLRTSIGERIGNPEFGTNLRNLLFESYQSEDELINILRQNIEEPIQRWINPPLNIKNIDIVFEDYNRANISIDFEFQSNPNESSNINITIVGQ